MKLFVLKWLYTSEKVSKNQFFWGSRFDLVISHGIAHIAFSQYISFLWKNKANYHLPSKFFSKSKKICCHCLCICAFYPVWLIFCNQAFHSCPKGMLYDEPPQKTYNSDSGGDFLNRYSEMFSHIGLNPFNSLRKS